MPGSQAKEGIGCAKPVVTENITVDGVIDMAGGWFDPLASDPDQPDLTAANTEHREATDALLVGRSTFEAFRDLVHALIAADLVDE